MYNVQEQENKNKFYDFLNCEKEQLISKINSLETHHIKIIHNNANISEHHNFFVCMQSHPELSSTILEPNKIFSSFISSL